MTDTKKSMIPLRLCRGFDGITYEQLSGHFSGSPNFLALSDVRKARLYLLLCKCRLQHDMYARGESLPAPNAVASEIDLILKSIKRIAEFSRSANDLSEKATIRAAMNHIYWGAEIWAEQNRSSLPPMFKPTTYSSDGEKRTSFGSSEVVAGFFDSADVIYKISRETKSVLKGVPKPRPRVTALKWLVGERLPQVYTTVFNLPFTSTAESEVAKTSDGITFVQTALKTINLRKSISGITIRGYITEHRNMSFS